MERIDGADEVTMIYLAQKPFSKALVAEQVFGT